MLNPEDKKDVKNAMGKAIANKVSKATKDSTHDPFTRRQTPILRAKVKMGGTTTKNGVPFEAGPSKHWSESDEKAHQSDVKAGRSWNKMGRSGAKNPHL